MLWTIGMLGAIFLFTWLPRRAKYKNCKNLKDNAKIISIDSKSEGFGSATTIRTYVTFDDGFIYSSCKVYSSLTTQFVNDEIRQIIVNDAVSKHRKLLEKKYISK